MLSMLISELMDCLNNNLGIRFTKILANESVNDPTLIPMLIQLAKSNVHPSDWRAAWVLDHISQLDYGLIEPHLNGFADDLCQIKSKGVQRHFLKMIAYGGQEAIHNGHLVDLCFDWLMSEQTPIASKAHCMEILKRLTLLYPEFSNELVPVLNEIATNGSKGEKNKAYKVLAEIMKNQPK